MQIPPLHPRESERKATTSGYEFLLKENIYSWLIWALFPLITLGGTYQHAVKTISTQNAENVAAIKQIHPDDRVTALTLFMEKHHFAKPYYVKDYIESADRYHIDYRIVAAISLAESSGCKHYLYDDCFGFGSSTGLRHFTSIPEGIRYVSQQLGENRIYAGKPDFVKAQNYGPHECDPKDPDQDPKTCKKIPVPWYAPNIIKFVNEIQSYE